MRHFLRWLRARWQTANFNAVMRRREAEIRKNETEYANKGKRNA